MRALTPKQIVAAAAIIVGVTLVAPLAASEPPQLPNPQSAQSSEPVTAFLDGSGLSALTTTTVPPTTTTTEAPVTTTTEAPQPEPVSAAPSAPPTGGGDPNDPASWERLAGCETGGTYNWATNTGNGYFGGLQFSLSSWQAVGGTGYPHEASKATQIEMGKRLHAQGGWHHWPGCSRSFGWI